MSIQTDEIKNKVMEIMIAKRGKFLLGEGSNYDYDDALVYVATILKNIESIGYTLSEEIIDILVTLEFNDIISFYDRLTTTLKSLVGDKGFTNVMYPNFPSEVMEKSAIELYVNAVIHYLSEGQLLPLIEKKERFPLIDNPELTVLELGTEEEFFSIFTNLVASKGSISKSDKEIIFWFAETYKGEMLNHLPEEIPNKEVLSFVTGLFMTMENIEITQKLIPYFRTATDVLRLAVSMSEGDVSLSTVTKFKSFKRRERRFLLALLEHATNIEEDMLRFRNQWVRLGEKIHPSEYKSYEKANLAFYKLRNNVKIETFNGKLEKAFLNNEIRLVVKLLSKRPGEFSRRLDQTLRMAKNIHEERMVVKTFELISKEVSSPVLLQTRSYFIDRCKYKVRDMRVFSPKGVDTKLYGIDYDLKEVNKDVCREIVQICSKALKDLYREKESLPNIYVDRELMNLIVPTSQRSANKTLKTLVRGSKFKIDEKTETIRPFIYWKEPNGERTDLDLSVVLYDKDFKMKEQIYWRNLVSDKFGCVHSGDIVTAPNGAHEFIDMNLALLKEKGVRYVTIVLQSYTYQNFSDLPECFIGVMERENALVGEVFEAKTVKIKADVSNGNEINIPMMIDLKDGTIVWTDLVLNLFGFGDNSVLSQSKTIKLNTQAMFNVIKPNLYDLFVLHARARGTLVKTKEEADIIYSLDGDVSPYDVDIIMANFL